MLNVKIFTLYPELFPGPLNIGLYKKAKRKKIWSLKVINIRDYSKDKHKTVDDTPYGGGNGMLMRPDVIADALDKNINIKKKEKTIYLSPKGKKFDQILAKEFSKLDNINIICGHFEGVDQRVLETRNIEEISLGDYILSGGETASFVFLDTIIRLLPGVLGNKLSTQEESFENSLLEYPQYTRPQKWEKKSPPDVLLSGDHAKIKEWRLVQSEDITRRRRPDLWKKHTIKKKNEKY
jgi:tRNA (guanine37-N1)-methyltransferase